MHPGTTWGTDETGPLADEDRGRVARQRAKFAASIEDADRSRAQLVALQELLESDSDAREDPAGPGGAIQLVRFDGIERPVVAGQLICRTSDVGRLEQILADADAALTDRIDDDALAVTLLSFEPSEVLAAVVERAAAEDLMVGPNEVTMQALWRVKELGSPEPTSRSIGVRPLDGAGAGVTVGVIDGGFADVDRDDGWLDGVIAPTTGDPRLDVDQIPGLDAGAGHGTFVTGVVRQVASQCDVRQYRALNSLGFGQTWRLKDAIVHAVRDGCEVINLSVGYESIVTSSSPAITVCLHHLPDHVLVVAAAGNGGSPTPILPAAHKRVIGVGALDHRLDPAVWSNHGPWVDVSCVGEGIVSTFVNGTDAPQGSPAATEFAGPNPVALWSGTSFAAPQVSGMLAGYLGAGLAPHEAVGQLRRDAAAQVPVAEPEFGFRMRIL